MDKEYKKGVAFALISLFFVSMQPIILNSRPTALDAWIFAAMTVIVMAIVYFPMMLIEKNKFKHKEGLSEEGEVNVYPTNIFRNHKLLFIYIGINFAIAHVLFVIAYELAGTINGSLAAQTMIIFGLIFGYIINHEKITLSQVLFSCLLFLGLFLAITQGRFDLVHISVGIFIMFGCTAIWMSAHAIVKPYLDYNEFTPVQLAFLRNAIAGLILISTYFIFFPISNIGLLFEPINIFFYVAMGIFYALDLIYYYKSISKIEVSKVAVLVSPMPILTAFLAYLILGEIFTIYHLVGTIIIMTSVMMIIRTKKE